MKVNVDTFDAWSDANYPRPDLCRESWLNLNGQWSFATDSSDEGLTLGWYLPGVTFSKTITVPFPPGSPDSGWSGERSDVVWYRRTITPEDLLQAGADDTSSRQHLRIHFEAVDFTCDVWINGRHHMHHEGGYTPFTITVDSSDYLDDGLELVVRAQDRLDAVDQPRGKQDWQENPHGIWYHSVVGIWRDVWMEVVPEGYIGSLTWSWVIENAQVTCDIALSGLRETSGDIDPIEASLTLELAGETLAASMVRIRSRSLRLVAQIPGLANRQEWGAYCGHRPTPTSSMRGSALVMTKLFPTSVSAMSASRTATWKLTTNPPTFAVFWTKATGPRPTSLPPARRP